MGIVVVVWTLAGLVCLAAFVWLLVVAFKKHVLWGLGVLFLSPVAAIVFAIKYWPESRKPFLIYMGTSVIGLLCFLYTFSALGGFQMIAMARQIRSGQMTDQEAAAFVDSTMERWENSGMLSEEQREQLREMRARMREGQAPGDAAPASPAPSAAVPHLPLPRHPRPDRLPAPSDGSTSMNTFAALDPPPAPAPKEAAPKIPLGEAGSYVGKYVRVVEKDGLDHRGLLASVDADCLMLERYLSGGTMALELRKADIESLYADYR